MSSRASRERNIVVIVSSNGHFKWSHVVHCHSWSLAAATVCAATVFSARVGRARHRRHRQA